MTETLFFPLLFALACSAAGAAWAGSDNSILVEQSSPVGAAEGNTLSIDQTAARNSAVAGVTRNTLSLSGPGTTTLGAPSPDSVLLATDGSALSFAPASPALQSGSANAASVILGGSGTQVGLSQTGSGNTATIDASAGQALLSQNGTLNTGSVSVSSGAALGSLLQDGNGNTGSVSVAGQGVKGQLAQIGNDNTTNLSVESLSSPSVSYTVQGNNLTTAVPASVFTSNGGQVTIVQQQLVGSP